MIDKKPEFSLEILSKNIKFERLRRGLSQRELAIQLGFKGTSTVTFWEKGDAFPPLETFLAICKFFGKTPNSMLCDDDDPDGSKEKLYQSRYSVTDEETIAYGGASRATAEAATESPPTTNSEERILKLQVMKEIMQQMAELEKT